MKTRHEIHYLGLLLEVAGYFYYEPQGDYNTFEIHEVLLDGADISVLFNDYSELESITLKEHY